MAETIESTLKQGLANTGTHHQPLSENVSHALQSYLDNLAGQTPVDIYEMVLKEVEGPLFEVIMQYTRGNQSRAAIILGLSRGTLRKKLKQYDLLD